MNSVIRIFIGFFLLSSLSCHASNKEQTFDFFWSKFRAAALAEDYMALNDLIKFPLEVRGVDDATPAKFYPREKLPEIFPQLLAQVVYDYSQDNLTENSLKALIQKKATINVASSQNKYRVDQFEFEKINNRWWLVRVYLE